MEYSKTIVCLANSRKNSGHCVAGIDIGDDYGQWIRPVSDNLAAELSYHDCQYKDVSSPQLLDIIYIQFKDLMPYQHQKENHLIDNNYYWEKIGRFDWDKLNDLTDDDLGALWIDNQWSSTTQNDRVPDWALDDIEDSLRLIQPEDLRVYSYVDHFNGKRRVRAKFNYQMKHYNLAITDPVIESYYKSKEIGEYPVKASEVFMCISLGEVFNGYAYKLVASIIPRPAT